MNTTIWKFTIDFVDDQAVIMPEGAKILCVQSQDGNPCIWALVNPEAPKVSRRIVIHGTGHPCPEAVDQYVGTFQMRDGRLVFHVFDCGEI